MAEHGGHAPHAARWRRDLFSKESRRAGPVHVPWMNWHSRQELHLRPAGSKPVALNLLSYGSMKGCPWQDLHPHWTASEAVVSALDYMGMEVAASGGLPLLRLCSFCSAPHDGALPRTALAPPTVRFKAGCSAVELQGRWQTGRIPRCRPGRLLLPRQASSLALSYPNEMDARPGLAPGKAVLRTAGSSALPCARLKIGSPSRFCPGAASFTTRNAAVTLWRECEMGPPVGLRLLPLCRFCSAPQEDALPRSALTPT